MANSSLATLRTEVRRILLDKASSANSRWSDGEIRGFFNAALLDMSRLAKRTKLDTPISFAISDKVKAWAPTDYMEIFTPIWTITSSGKQHELKPGADRYPFTDETGKPLYYWHIDGNIHVRPIPSEAGTLTMMYYRRFQELSADTDIPEPVDADDILIARGLASALKYDGNALLKQWEDEYNSLLGAWAMDEKRRNKQPVSRRVRVLPFR